MTHTEVAKVTRDSRGYVAISLTYGHVRWQGLRSHFSFPPHFGDPQDGRSYVANADFFPVARTLEAVGVM